MTFLQRVIHNDAMKTDPTEIYSLRVLFIACCACFGGLLFGFDIGTIGGVITMPTFQESFHMRDVDGMSKVGRSNLQANIVSVMQLGAFGGALLAIPIADKLGRKPGMFFVAASTLIGVILQAASMGHLSVMYIGRFIAGLGLGAATMVTPTYVSECSPRALRGALTGLYQLFETIGAMLAFWISYGSLLHIKGTAMWAIPLGLQGLPAILLAIGMCFCSETPRFLAKNDNWEKATAVLARTRNLSAEHPYVQAELTEMRAQLEEERRIIGGSGWMDLLREMITVPSNRKRTGFSIMLMVCQQLTGTNAVNFYAPKIFASLGLAGTEISLFATGIYGVTKVIGCAAFLLFMADSLGRKLSLVVSSTAMGIAMFYLGFFVRFDRPIEGAPVTNPGYAALVMVYIFAVCFQLGWGPVCWIYVSEIPTARLRALNVALAASTQWLFNFAISRATPPMLDTVGAGGYGTYFFFGCFCFAMTLWVLLFIPETKGVSLERMDELFGGIKQKLDVEDVGDAARAASAWDQKEAAEHVEEVRR